MGVSNHIGHRGNRRIAVNNPLSDRSWEPVNRSAADAGPRKGGRRLWGRAAPKRDSNRLAPVEELERNAILGEVVHREIARVVPVPVGDRDQRMPSDSALDPKLGAPK